MIISSCEFREVTIIYGRIDARMQCAGMRASKLVGQSLSRDKEPPELE